MSREETKPKLLAVDYVRAYVILVVIAVHSFLAYFSFAPSAALKPFTSRPYAWVNYPVVDAHRWRGFDFVFLFNENLVLTLMFMMSGWFVWQSIAKKGRGGYLKGRLARLGIPLVLAIMIVSPLAYYPSYALREAQPTVAGYVHEWLSLDFWSPGPAWFIAVLLIFDVLVVLLHRFMPRGMQMFGRLCARAATSPAAFAMGIVAVLATGYVALCLYFGPIWLTHIPYEQTSRMLVFLLYFIVGIGMGVTGTQRGLLAPDGALALGWKKWLAACAATFVVYLLCLLEVESHAEPTLFWLAARNTAHLLCGAATCFFVMAFAVRFARKRNRILDSLGANAYGMYLLHFPFSIWSQYLMLDAPLSGMQKGIVAFVAAVAMSWTLVAAIRHALFAIRRIATRPVMVDEDPERVAGTV